VLDDYTFYAIKYQNNWEIMFHSTYGIENLCTRLLSDRTNNKCVVT